MWGLADVPMWRCGNVTMKGLADAKISKLADEGDVLIKGFLHRF
jgi:hypothetical protein